MAEVSIGAALDKLEASTVAARNDGLEDLKRIFGHARRSSKLDSLGDAGFQRILESLFGLVRTERSKHINASSPTARHAAELRLLQSSAAFRLVTDAAATRIKHKTAITVLDHVVDTLPVKTTGLFPPIRNDYTKTFRGLLQNPVLREHLKPQEWERLIEFIVEALDSRAIDDDSQSNGTNSRDASVDTRTESRMSMRVSQVSRGRTSRSGTSNHIEELVISLKLLTGTNNPALTAKSSSIVECCLNYLRTATKFQEPALEAMNNVFPNILANDTDLARAVAHALIPVLRRLWSTKMGSLKDQMLIFLMNARDLFSLSTRNEPLSSEATLLDDLFDTIALDYGRRQERDCLQLDDVYFPETQEPLPLRTSSIAPVRESPRALTNWSCVAILSTLVSTLDMRYSSMTLQKNEDATPSKRRKIESPLGELVRQATSSSPQERLWAIQTLLFAVDECEATKDYLVRHVTELGTGLSHDDDSVANWSMLLMSRLAYTAASKMPDLKQFWTQSYSLVARSVSSHGLSRAACHFLDSVLRAGVFDGTTQPEILLDAMFANGSQGPCLLTDTALSLWHSILGSGVLTSAEAFHNASLRAIGWLSTLLTLPSVLDRLHNASLARHSREDNVYKLFVACMNIPATLREQDFSIVTSPIYTRLAYATDSLSVSRYLLHQPDSNKISSTVWLPSSSVTIDASSRTRLEHTIAELLLVKLKTFQDSWSALQQERSSNVNTDIVQILSSTCVIACSVSATMDDSMNALCKDIVATAGKVWHDLCGLISTLEGDLRQRCLVLVASSLLRIDLMDKTARMSLAKMRQALTSPVLDMLRQGIAQGLSRNEIEDDLMDAEDSLSVRDSQKPIESYTKQITRQNVSFAADLHTAMVQLTCRLLVSELEGRFSDDGDPRLASAVIDFAADLSPADLVAARQPLTEFFDSSPSIARTDASRLLQILAETCLQDSDFERCEGSLCFCVDVLASLAKLWTLEDDDSLASMACDIYEWYLETAVGKGIATEKVMLAIARMLIAVSASDSTFGSRMSLPSPRTSLLRLLKAGNHIVQFNLAGLVCLVFDGFVLNEHGAIFDDVVASLPADAERVEGIAVRLYILGRLASRWHTLLRKAVYSIFETAAKVIAVMPFAQKCFKDISNSLYLQETRELLILFSPQILYTWLETESLDSIPFQAFDYIDLVGLLRDIQNEAVGQIAMRASTSHATAIAQLTGRPWNQMVHAGFTQAESYCIARDIGTPRGEQSKASEAKLRKQLGSETYLQLIQESFPQILARLFTIISDDQGVENALSKRSSLSAAHATLIDICRRSQSTTVLPKSQQPSFRSKYIFDEIDYLCKRIDQDSTSMWEPSLVVYVCRMLFDSAVPALGPLHSCAVIRKVRIVVCLAESQALRGYALEMLLHTLRPFLTDFHCSEDALGLFWYLLDHGKSYLESHVAFLASLTVSTFVNLSSFLDSSQDSTTQETHFKSTMSRVQMFRDWMVKYLHSFKPADVSNEISKTFSTITHLASGISGQGGSARGTPQGDLVYLLLQDQRTSDRLLTHTAFVQVMETMCVNFKGAVDPRDDILYSDEDAVEFGPILWALLSKIKSDSFAVWVAQVLGRAYACSGHVNGADKGDQSLGEAFNSTTNITVQGASYVTIVNSLATMLRKDDRPVSGMAERALQVIFTALSVQERSTYFSSAVGQSLLHDLAWRDFHCPQFVLGPDISKQFHAPLAAPHQESAQKWASSLAIALCGRNESNPILLALPTVLAAVPGLATNILPSMVHIILLAESSGHQPTRQALSAVVNETLADWREPSKAGHIEVALDILLYLRHQSLPSESTMADRNTWLDVNLTNAAEAASSCGMQSAALLFLELAVSQQALQPTRNSRRSSFVHLEQHDALLQQIFSSIDDPDFFFGMQEKSSLQSVLNKLAHEDSAYKNLSFQSALFDSQCRLSNSGLSSPDSDVVAALSKNNLNGIAQAVQLQASRHLGSNTGAGVLQVALNLSQWDLPHQAEQHSSAAVVLGTFRALESFSSKPNFVDHVDEGLKLLLSPVTQDKLTTKTIQSNFSAMAILTELRELLSATGIESVQEEMANQTARADWEAQESFELVLPILLGREAAITAIKGSDSLRTHFRISLHEARSLEITTVRNSLRVARSYSAAQFCLNRAMYLSKLMETPAYCSQKVDAAVLHDTAHVLWDQGETSDSISVLSQLNERNDLGDQTIAVSRAEILADLGHRVAEARLSKPDEIIAKYLVPAIDALHGKSEGGEAGRVFHNFAVFCDMQLQNAEDKEEFTRVEGLRQSKMEEVEGLRDLIRSSDPKRKDNLRKHYDNANKWFKLDDDEYQRLKKIREKFIAQSLENYLRSMAASDTYPNDTLRFVALWLDQSESENAQAAVGKHLATVSSRKFAPLMNQLFSRILDSSDPFQQLLTNLLYRVCCDHPHHSLYQLFAASKSKGAKNDIVANSRYSAAGKLAEKVMKQSHSGNLWVALHNCSIAFVRLANEKLTDQKIKSGSKIMLRNIEYGRKLEQTVHDSSTKIPPPTMKILLRADYDYSSTPTILKFDSGVSIAGGVSAPKILTVVATDGSRYKMLLKGGNDDLRQDSIMEQVFEQVSNLLKDHRTTRKRNLSIRTYKVLPLTPNAGIIEFVKNTVPLHEYLLPAHQKYHPKDWKPNKCRKDISDAQSKTQPQRVQAYRTVCDNFHPVMRFFFMERFLEPDEWFRRRLAYSRSVAATSILGHVLGLGDRHGHNILLDEQTGEVVHIDLGVAFEAGRILPVPENVPFRLTRDMVDGMGLSGVEGVFRRCCNFTLEALRQDQYSIMTVLDVLRYDPLYSWSITPLRLQKMQEAQDVGRDGDNVEESRRSSARGRAATPEDPKAKKIANQASEADRALTVVAKKLGKSLSVEATVNELIQQATDEKNLATLYCGWAAYA